MPEGSTESVRDLDLDEQVQQLVESIETTTRDITAPADEEHSDDAMDSPEDLIAHAAADEAQEPETEAPTSAGSEVEEDFGEEAFLSPEEMTAEPEAIEEPEATPEPAPAPIPEPADSVEQVEAAMGQIDEAVDQLVENAVEAVEPEPAPEPEPVAPPNPEPADAVEEVIEDVFEAPETEAVTEPVEDCIEEAAAEPVEAIAEVINDENLDVVIEAPEDEAEVAEDDDEKGPYDEFAIDGDFDSVEDDAAAASDDDEDDIDDFGEITTEAPSPAPAEAAPEPEPEQAPEPAPAIAAASKAKKPSPFAAMAAILAPLLEKAVVLVNAPVSRLSPSIRQFVGWSAINFAFLAAVILIVVVLRSMR